ncbi:MAG: hypothetical protein ABI196_00625 [Bradyrhizobium sp.]
MAVPAIKSSFAVGELSPALYGHVDLAKFAIAASTMRNVFVNYRGGAYSRAGTAYVARSKQDGATQAPPRLIHFQFNINQGYALEFGDNYVRFYSNGAAIVEGGVAITGATRANPCVLTTGLQTYSNGDWITIAGVGGMTQLNGQTYIVQGNTGTSLHLTDLNGGNLDSTGFGAFTGSGTAFKIYTLSTPYAASDLALLKFTQSADVMSFTHPNYPPYDLARIASNDWTLTAVNFSSAIAAPASCSATATTNPSGLTSPPTLPTAYAYCVTAISNTGEESVASPIANVTNSVDISSTAGSLIVNWSSVTGANIYNIYKAPTSYNTDPGNVTNALPVPAGALFGLVGTSYGTQFVDSNVTADDTQVPPLHFNPFTGGQNPGVVAYYQQRRVYAATNAEPDTYWMSQPGKFLNFDKRIPTSDSDSIQGTPWAQQVNGIQFMLPMPGGLVVLTGLGAWQVGGAGGSALNPQAITPASQQAQPQAFNGCSARVPPFAVNYDILYVQAKGSIVRDLAYNYWVNIYTGTDLTELSSHLFTGFTINEWAWCEEPYKIVWLVRNDGTLLSLTYLKEQEVFGWARHDTQGFFHSVCNVTEPPVDALYLVSQRYPEDGNAGRGGHYYIERMDNRIWNSVEDPWCVDCGLQLPLTSPNITLGTNSTSGIVTFTSINADFFNSGHVGWVIRMGGGIAVITSFQDARHVIGNFVTPITRTRPNALGNPAQNAGEGEWTIAPQVVFISGLTHLVGLQVTGLADGIPIPSQIVNAAGTITLTQPASDIKIGLAFQAQVQSVYLDGGAQPTIQGRRKDIVAVTVRVEASGGIKVGTNQPDGSAQVPPSLAPAWSRMVPITDQGATYFTPSGGLVTNLFTGDLRVNVPARWDKHGQVAVQQDNPLPLQITALIPEALEGDVPEQTYKEKPQGGSGGQQQEQPRGPGSWMLRA